MAEVGHNSFCWPGRGLLLCPITGTANLGIKHWKDVQAAVFVANFDSKLRYALL